MTTIHFTEMGTKPIADCAAWHIATMARNRERRLLGLHCGQTLGRGRHDKWAARKPITIEPVVSSLPFKVYAATY